jgi:hypothetical protein
MTPSAEQKDPKKPAEEKPKEEKPAEQKPAEEPKAEAEEEISEEEAEKLPFPTAAVVRIMKANMDGEKMIKKDVKIGMNKWLGDMCARVSREMNKFPYVMMHLNELKEGKRIYEDMESFDKEKQRILAHLDAMKKDIERLERDLGKKEEEVITREGKE